MEVIQRPQMVICMCLLLVTFTFAKVQQQTSSTEPEEITNTPVTPQDDCSCTDQCKTYACQNVWVLFRWACELASTVSCTPQCLAANLAFPFIPLSISRHFTYIQSQASARNTKVRVWIVCLCRVFTWQKLVYRCIMTGWCSYVILIRKKGWVKALTLCALSNKRSEHIKERTTYGIWSPLFFDIQTLWGAALSGVELTV